MPAINHLLNTTLNFSELLVALRKRERTTVSFFEFCLDRSIFSKSTLLQILEHQELNRTLFEVSVEAIAGQEFTRDLIEIYSAHQVSLLSILTDKPEDLLPIAESSNHYLESTITPLEVLVEEPAAIEALGSENIPKLKKFDLPDSSSPELDPDLIEDFLQTFDEDKKSEIENIIMGIKKVPDDSIESIFSHLYREFHTLKGSARFTHLKMFEAITHELEDLISEARSVYIRMSVVQREVFEEALLIGVDVLWVLRKVINQTHSEFGVFEDEVWMERTNILEKSLQKAKALAFELLQTQNEDEFLSKF